MTRAAVLKQAEAATLLGVTRQAVTYFLGTGALKAQVIGGHRFVTRASVDRLARTPRKNLRRTP